MAWPMRQTYRQQFFRRRPQAVVLLTLIVWAFVARPVPPSACQGTCWLQPQALDRRALSTFAAISCSIASGVFQLPCFASNAKEETLRADIDNSFRGLTDLLQRWDKEIAVGDQYQAGILLVRNALIKGYQKDDVVIVPGGQSLGVKVNACKVTDVENPAFGWTNGDLIVSINGIQLDRDAFALQSYLAEAKAKGQETRLEVKRPLPPLLDSLERRVQAAYNMVDIDDLPELQDVQVDISNTRAFSSSAASASSKASLQGLRRAVKNLVEQLEPIVKALA